MSYVSAAFDASALNDVVGDLVRSGLSEGNARAKLAHVERWALDAESNSYLLKSTGFREATLYLFFPRRGAR